MAVAKSATSVISTDGSASSATTVEGTSTITVGASDTFLLLFIEADTSTPGTVTAHWDSAGTNQLMTQIGLVTDAAGATPLTLVCFGLVNPTPGAKKFSWSFSGQAAAVNAYHFSISFTGSVTSSVAAVTEGLQTNNGSAANCTVTSSAVIPSGDMAVTGYADLLGYSNAFTSGTNPGDGGTAIGKNETLTTNMAGEYYSGSGSTIASSTAQAGTGEFVALIVGIKASAAATTVVGMQRRGRLFSPRSGPSRGLRTAYAYPSKQIVLSAATGVFNETGVVALFRISELAAPGSFSEIGKAALFQVRELAAKGTFNETGVAALFRISEVATKGTFNETGNAALFQVREVAAKGTFNETGNAALFQVRELASKGTFNETGKPVLFKTIMGSSAGSYVVTGNAAKLTLATVLIASTGSFSETGKAAAFRITQKAAPGSVAVTGLSTSFRLSMPSAKGTFNETGVSANFRVLFRSAPGSFAVSGSAAHSTLKLTLLPGVFLVNGRPANLVISGSLIPEKNTTLKNVLVRSRIMVRGSRRFRSLKNETVIRRSRTLP